MVEVETSSQGHTDIPALFPLPKGIDTNKADIIIQSPDNANFPVHKLILASSSQFFRDMFSLPQPSNTFETGLPVVRVSEDAEIVRALITVLYPIPSEIPSSYNVVLGLLAAAQKYDMPGIQSSIRAEVSQRNLLASTGAEAVIYGIASKNKLLPEMQTAARLSLYHPLTFEHLGEGLREFEACALRDLANFRKSCRDSLVSCLESFLDTQNSPSKTWNGCSKLCDTCSRSSYLYQIRANGSALPSWLRDLLTEWIGKLKQSFTSPLLNPSNIREEYLLALKQHYSHSGGCTCFTTHVLQGEEYYKELVRQLTGALDKACSAFTSKEISS
jgi:BTB/POZ domain